MESPLNSKIEKRALLPHFTMFVQIFKQGKNTNFSPSSFGDHIVFIRQTDDFCFSFCIKDYWFM